MAEVSGPGLLGSDLTAGLADAIMAQAAALSVEYDTMKEYKNLVDGLLTSLGDSQADHGKLAHGTLPAGVLGTGFPEAEDLYKSYNTVHSELQNLSKGLAGQIEALGIAILTAGKGFGGVDEETRRRMAAIAKEAHDSYVEKRDPYAGKTGEAPTPNSPSVNGEAKRGSQI
ncbi:hypothetical protein OG765_22230 [Streptomyces sp. NBC_00555]|uniref:hypothetical protein n=1 Tax=Streptomyces sp. NBC_00555 TaxID=2903662 RepID=UPI002256B314|nr:hypothetical protein [Streptomyces sp. NBC_00555]MCX5013688.1 hypothetical protein [Streptomyces sp. NBC_00555]